MQEDATGPENDDPAGTDKRVQYDHHLKIYHQ